MGCNRKPTAIRRRSKEIGSTKWTIRFGEGAGTRKIATPSLISKRRLGASSDQPGQYSESSIARRSLLHPDQYTTEKDQKTRRGGEKEREGQEKTEKKTFHASHQWTMIAGDYQKKIWYPKDRKFEVSGRFFLVALSTCSAVAAFRPRSRGSLRNEILLLPVRQIARPHEDLLNETIRSSKALKIRWFVQFSECHSNMDSAGLYPIHGTALWTQLDRLLSSSRKLNTTPVVSN